MTGVDGEPATWITFPPGARFNAVDYPRRPLRPPEVVRLDAGPAEWLEFSQRFWDRPQRDRRVEFYRLSDVYVTDPGFVFDADGRLFEETAPPSDAALVAPARAQLQAALNEGRIERREGVALLCGKNGLFNYGHWMVEMLPLAFLAREHIEAEGWSVFVPNVTSVMGPVIRESLSMLGVAGAAVIENDGRPVAFQDLIVVTGVARLGEFFTKATVEAMAEIARPVEPEGAERAWISRIGTARTLRRETELCAALSDRGWSVLDPGRMSLVEQIAAAKACRHMAGVNGAGLTNMGFMPAPARVTNFLPCDVSGIFFSCLAANLGASYKEVRCPVAGPPGTARGQGFLEVAPDAALALLE